MTTMKKLRARHSELENDLKERSEDQGSESPAKIRLLGHLHDSNVKVFQNQELKKSIDSH